MDGNKQLAKYAKIVSSLPNLKCLVVWDETIDPEIAAKCAPVRVCSWVDFMEMGAAVPDSDIDARCAVIQPGHCSTLIYTSGTTGPPKAVMVSHDNITWTAANMCENYMDLNHTDRVVSYLPLSHIAAQLIDIHAPLNTGLGE